MEKPTINEEQKSEPVGRNEPCPCGSGKKYKRCHGVSAAPKLSAPAQKAALPGMSAQGMPSADQLDPQALMQMSQLLQRLPKGQMQRLQAIMQKAMAGKDVSREAAEFERTLPPNFKDSLQQMMPAFAGAMGQPTAESTPAADQLPPAGMDLAEAKRLVAEAAASGQISKEQADQLLSAAETDVSGVSGPGAGESSSATGFGKLWGKLTGKK